jgi:ribose/xylose/arabinose/galactoside ABC-type transport system permease subunit
MNKFLIYWKKFGMFTLLFLLVAIFSIASPKLFFSSTTLFNILKQASIVGVLSCGVTILLIMGEIDISVGSRVAFITIVAGKMLNAGSPIWLVVLVAIAIGALTGALNALIAQVLHTYMFVVTLATSYIWTGTVYLMNGAVTLYGFPNGFKNISQYLVFGYIPNIILIFVACAIVSGFILAKTYFGRYIYAIGGNREAAYLAGIGVKKNTVYAHALAGVFFGIASIILMSRTMTAFAGTGGTYAFDCITACVLGGVLLIGGQGSMYQAMLGVLVINVLFNGLTFLGVGDYWQSVVKGLTLILAIGIEVLQRYAKVDLSARR